MLTIDIESQARYLADENRKSDPSIQRVLWFPHMAYICLVELTENVPASLDGEVQPFWFRASAEDGLTVPSGIALIRPEERGKLQLPEDWGTWDDAKEL